jgi:restriction system protein
MVSDAAPPSPTYADIGHAVRVLDGVPAKRLRDLMNAIFEQAGSWPRSIDWSDPDRWIDERLVGDLRKLARKVWEQSGKTLNPRYLYGHYAFINRLKLLQPVGGIYRLGERGRRFLAGDDEILRELVALRSARRRGLADAGDGDQGR